MLRFHTSCKFPICPREIPCIHALVIHAAATKFTVKMAFYDSLYDFYYNVERRLILWFVLYGSYLAAVIASLGLKCFCCGHPNCYRSMRRIVKLVQLVFGSNAVQLKHKKEYATNGPCIKVAGLYFKLNGTSLGPLVYHTMLTVAIVIIAMMEFFFELDVSYACTPELHCFNGTTIDQYLRSSDTNISYVPLITNCSLFNEEDIITNDGVKCYHVKPTASTGIALLGGFVIFVPRIAWGLACFFNLKIGRCLTYCIKKQWYKKGCSVVCMCSLHLLHIELLSILILVLAITVVVPSVFNLLGDPIFTGEIFAIILLLGTSIFSPMMFGMLQSEVKKGGYPLDKYQYKTLQDAELTDQTVEDETSFVEENQPLQDQTLA